MVYVQCANELQQTVFFPHQIPVISIYGECLHLYPYSLQIAFISSEKKTHKIHSALLFVNVAYAYSFVFINDSFGSILILFTALIGKIHAKFDM